MPKIYLTDTLVKSLKCSDNKDQELFWDHPRTSEGGMRNGAIRGLGLRVTRQGIKTYVHSYIYADKRRRFALGSPPVMNVVAARMAVTQRELLLANGESPDSSISSRHSQNPATIRELVDSFWEARMVNNSEGYQVQFALYVAPWRRQAPNTPSKRGRNRRKKYQAFGEVFADHLVNKIKPRDIEEFLQQFENPSAYNMALKHTATMFNWAIRMQIVDMRNPCNPLDVRKVIKQRRNYSEEQIAAITQHIFNPPQQILPVVRGAGVEKQKAALALGRMVQSNQQMLEFCAFAGILFLTMARPVELMRAEFSHFDLERLIWHKHHTKGLKLSNATYEYAYRSVPIHPKVAMLVEQQRQRWPGGNYVFSSHKDVNEPRDNFKRQVDQFRSLEGVPEYFQLYDLKRIAISLMLVGQGVRREDVSHYVDHKGDLATTMIYDLGFVDPLRPVTDRLGQLLGV